ncbi:MAG: hypothetical protein H7301_09170 [Cryobacterium sp.]|nr:hypothetical protein [Oligoflexia bacterium]
MGFDFQRVHNTTPSFRDIYDMENGVIAMNPVTGRKQRMGIGWAFEMPTARDIRDPAALKSYLSQLGEIVKKLGHGHPGLYYVVAGNEDWGNLEDDGHHAPVTDEQREAFQLKLIQTTAENGPAGVIISPEDGWRQATEVKNARTVPGIKRGSLLMSAHDYRGSGKELIEEYGGISVLAQDGQAFPANQKSLLLPGYEFAGDETAMVMGEFGGKSLAPPGAKNVFGYGHVYQDVGLWTRDMIDQLSAMGKIAIMRGGYVMTQWRDAGNKPHRDARPGEPGGELNGILYADGRPKSDPKLWAEANLQNLRRRQLYLQEVFTGRYSEPNQNAVRAPKMLGLTIPSCMEKLR